MNSIHVDFNAKTGRFVIHSPYWALETMRKIPNRKFEKRLDNAWTAPAIKANVKYLQESLPTNAVFTKAASDKMQEVLIPPNIEPDPFPRRYKFKREPRVVQMEALNRTYSRRVMALFMDMRTGKTKVVIDEAMAMFYEGKIDRLLIIPLKTLRRNWSNDFAEDANMDHVELLHLDTSKKKEFDKFNSSASQKLKVLLVGIESLSAGSAHDMCMQFLSGPKSMVVVDESDTIKNHKSIRTQKMFDIRDKSEYRRILTGTPISKGPMDFFSQFEFLDPEIFGIGDYYAFRNRYAIMGGFGDKEIVGYRNMEEFVDITRPYVYQVRYGDVFDSPLHVFAVKTVELTAQQKEIYRRIKKDNTIRKDGNIVLVVQNVLERMLRLQEVNGGFFAERIDTGKYTVDPVSQIRKPKYKYKHHKIPGDNPRIDCVVDTLTREFADDQGIVWAVHIEELKAIAEALRPHGEVALFHGDVDEDERNRISTEFKAGKIKWIVANPTTGGRGYTFSAAGVMINYSSSHNLIHRLQSLERATDPSKKVSVAIIDLVAEGTVDEIIVESNNAKMNVAEYVRASIEKKSSTVDALLF